MRPIIISIYGGSGAGKSTIAGRLEEISPQNFSRVPADRLIISRINKDPEYFKRPITYDWNLFEKLLQGTRLGDVIYLPQFDYLNFFREKEVSNKCFIVKKYLILDAIEPYQKADHMFYIDLCRKLRKQRIIERDKKLGTDIIRNWEWSILSADHYRKQFAARSRILDAKLSLSEICNLILSEIGFVQGS